MLIIIFFFIRTLAKRCASLKVQKPGAGKFRSVKQISPSIKGIRQIFNEILLAYFPFISTYGVDKFSNSLEKASAKRKTSIQSRAFAIYLINYLNGISFTLKLLTMTTPLQIQTSFSIFSMISKNPCRIANVYTYPVPCTR